MNSPSRPDQGQASQQFGVFLWEFIDDHRYDTDISHRVQKIIISEKSNNE
jgi:hypothetical protein